MTFPNGLYYIQSAKKPDSFVGVGPVIPVFPPLPSPLRLFGPGLKDTYVIEQTGGDTFTLKHQVLGYRVGCDEQGVRLLRDHEKGVQWAIDPSNPGCYRLHVANKDKYWTATEEDFNRIKVQGANGDKAQEWKLVPADY